MITINLNDDIETHKQLSTLVDKTNKDKPSSKDVQSLRNFLNEHPELCRLASNLTDIAISNFISKTDYVQSVKELLAKQAQVLKDDLGWRDASTLERLVIDVVVMSWMRWAGAEVIYTNKINSSHNIDSGQYWHKKLLANQNAYLRGCETLAKVRRLSRNAKEFMHDLSQDLPM